MIIRPFGHLVGRHDKCKPRDCEIAAKLANEVIAKYQDLDSRGLTFSDGRNNR